MEKLKKLLSITATNNMKWYILVATIIILLVMAATIHLVLVNKAKTLLANSNVEQMQNKNEEEEKKDIIKQEDLVDDSKLSEKESQNLTEKELEEKKKEEAKKQEEKKKNQEKEQNQKPVKNKYYIKVNYGAQVVTIYTYDKNGKYTVPVRACICSTGAATPTSGVYNIGWKATWARLYGNVWGHYSCQVVSDILFHSVPYMQASNDTLVSTYYDRLGSKDSMGCIRLTTIDAKWIFENCPSGTQVEFYSSSNPGPLGKPAARKVSNAKGNLKRWDPTDPDKRNPWIEYIKKEKEEEKNNQANTVKPGNNASENKPSNTQTTNTPSKPDTPTTPEEPATPDKPVESNPTMPDEPDTPSIPEEPEKPSESEKPNTPVEPEEPTNPSNPQNPEDTDASNKPS